MHKEITFYVFFGENRDPSEIYANSNLRNATHITQKPSYVYTFFTYTLKEITAVALIYSFCGNTKYLLPRKNPTGSTKEPVV
jgi:hypothetical protein